MDTLYVLCRSVDHRYAHLMEAGEADVAVEQKRAYFAAEAKGNPLVQAILAGGRVSYDHLLADDKRGFMAGPATFFRTHEILRKTREMNCPITIDGREFSHNEVADMFASCIPNAKLAHLPWCSLGRCRISLGLAWAATLLVAHFIARGQENDDLFDPFVIYEMGLVTTVVALIYTILKQNRDVRYAAPWNSAMYLDLNADLLRRNSPALAVARKEYVPQEKPFKSAHFYYALARKIESHGMDAELMQKLSACNSSGQRL